MPLPLSLPRDALERKLWIGSAIAIICIAVLALATIGRSYDAFQRARQSTLDMQCFRLALDAANFVSAERGPANSVMSEEPSTVSSSAVRLAEFRHRTDAALIRLEAETGRALGVPGRRFLTDLLDNVRRQLARARQLVDRVATMPRESRRVEDVEQAIFAMFEASDRLDAVIDWKAGQLVAANPDLTGPVAVGHILSHLREYAGRIASYVIAPIAVGKPMTLAQITDSRITRGRLLELWSLIEAQSSTFRNNPAIAGIRQQADLSFFGDGLALVDRLIAEGQRSGTYSMTAVEFTDRFVATFRPVERLRTVFLDIAIEQFSHLRDEALLELLAVTAITLVMVCLVVGLVILVQMLVFRPLLRARDNVIDLADDRPVVPVSGIMLAGEMRRLFEAIDVLRERLGERKALTLRLKEQAETDALTGLLNRRALDLLAEALTQDLVAAEALWLILVDIDHFKAINDGHGHPAGDHVLKAVAQQLRSKLRASDVFARFGGEEFAIVARGCTRSGAIDLAEMLRASLVREDFVLRDGTHLRVTASFGVAGGPAAQNWPGLVAAADAALYRAKADGRNRVRCAQESTKTEAAGRVMASAAPRTVA